MTTKKPVPKVKAEYIDPAVAEKIARHKFHERKESCLKSVEIRECRDILFQVKPGNAYCTVEQW